MCMPQDPVSKLLVKADPLAKVDGRLKIQEKYGDKMDPLGSAISRNDPVGKKLGTTIQRNDPVAQGLGIAQ